MHRRPPITGAASPLSEHFVITERLKLKDGLRRLCMLESAPAAT